MISLIVAVDKNGCIGLDGKMPWHIKEELKHFKEYTWGKKVLIGRKTFEGLGKPLTNRYHYLLTSKNIEIETGEIVTDLATLIDQFKNNDEELVVIGGAQVYKKVLDIVDKMIISVIQNEYNGDTYFPKFDMNRFDVESIQTHDEFIVYTLIRKEN